MISIENLQVRTQEVNLIVNRPICLSKYDHQSSPMSSCFHPLRVMGRFGGRTGVHHSPLIPLFSHSFIIYVRYTFSGGKKPAVVVGLLSVPRSRDLGSRFLSTASTSSEASRVRQKDNLVDKKGGKESAVEVGIREGTQDQQFIKYLQPSLELEKGPKGTGRGKKKGMGMGKGSGPDQFSIMSGSMSSFSGLKNVPPLSSAASMTSLQSKDYDGWDPLLTQRMRNAELMLLTNDVLLDGTIDINALRVDSRIHSAVSDHRPDSRPRLGLGLGLGATTAIGCASVVVRDRDLEDLRKSSIFTLPQIWKDATIEIPESSSVSSVSETDAETDTEVVVEAGEGVREGEGEEGRKAELETEGEIEADNEIGKDKALAVIAEAVASIIPTAYKGERKLSNKERIIVEKFIKANRAVKCLDMYDDQDIGEVVYEEESRDETNYGIRPTIYVGGSELDIFDALGATPVNEDEWGDRDSDSDSDIREKDWLRSGAPSSESAVTISVAAYNHLTDGLQKHGKSIQGMIVHPMASSSPHMVNRKISRGYEVGQASITVTPTVSDCSTPTVSPPGEFNLLYGFRDEMNPILSELDEGRGREEKEEEVRNVLNGGQEEEKGLCKLPKSPILNTDQKDKDRERERERERDRDTTYRTGSVKEGGGMHRKSGKRKKSNRVISLVPEGDEDKDED